MIYIFKISVYLRVNLIFKKYLYNFFRIWKYFKNRLFIYLFNMNIINMIFNCILVFIYISFLIVVWNFLISFLNICPRFLISCVVFIDIDKGLKYSIKLTFYRI